MKTVYSIRHLSQRPLDVQYIIHNNRRFKMYIYRRAMFLILISMTAYFCSLAQDANSENNSLKEGAWAMQFGITSNFTLTSFQGTTVALKYQLSDRDAVRGGITINGSTVNGNSSVFGWVADTSYGSVPGNTTTDAANVSFTLQYLRYVNPNGPVHFYIGLGPTVSYTYSHSTSDKSSLNTLNSHGYWVETESASSSTQWAIGGTCVAGVEWFACQWLSIRADYSEGIQRQWGSTTSISNITSLTYPKYVPSHTNNPGTTKGWTLSSSGVSFGLSVYW